MLLIHKVLAVHRDLALGKGTVVQQRGLFVGEEHKIELAFIFRTVDEIKDLDITRYLRIQLHQPGDASEYWYDELSLATPDDISVIKPNNISITDAGRWLLVEIIVEYSASATNTPGNTIEQDVNAMDWSGHPYAIGSTLSVLQNHIVIFDNQDGKTYLWSGPKPVLIGLNGTYQTKAEDYLPLSTTQHEALVDVTPDQHHNQAHEWDGPDHLNIPPTFPPNSHAHDGVDGSGQVSYNDLLDKPADGASEHDDLLGVTPDQHHNQAHEWDGPDHLNIPPTFPPSAHTHAHADTTGQTADDHHPQLHNIDSHTDVDTTTELPLNNDRLGWDATLLKWVPKQSASALGIVAFDYRIVNPTATPAPGRLAGNDADASLVTIVYINEEDNHGDDKTLFLENLDKGDWLNIHDPDATTTHRSYDVTGVPTLVADVWHVPVVFFDEVGPPLSNNQRVTLFIRYTSTLSHDGLVDVTPDQHHAESHTLPSHSDVIIAGPVLDDVLTYDGADWINKAFSAGGSKWDDATGGINYSGGDVGVGATDPFAKLDVRLERTDTPAWTQGPADVALFERDNGSTGGSQVIIASSSAGSGSLYFADRDSKSVGRVQYSHSLDAMQFFSNSAETMRNTSDSCLAVGLTTSTGAGTVNALNGFYENGVKLASSKWDDATEGINYSGGRVGIGVDNLSASLYVGKHSDGSAGVLIATHSAAVASDLALSANAVFSGESSLSSVLTTTGGYYRWMFGADSNLTGTAGATEYMRLAANGCLEVGTTISSGAGTVNALNGFYENGVKVTGGKWDDATGGINYSGGNVGIGTSSPEDGKLVVKRDGAGSFATFGSNAIPRLHITPITSLDTARMYITHNVYRDPLDVITVEDPTLGATALHFQDGVMSFLTGPASTSFPPERMRINSAGNVGIGITTPSVSLHVSGQAIINNGTWISDGGVWLNGVNDFQVGVFKPASTVDLTLRGQTMLFQNNAGSERMRIDSAGSVIINGTTPAPNSVLTLYNKGTYIPALYVESSGGSWAAMAVKHTDNPEGRLLLIQDLATDYIYSEGASALSIFKVGAGVIKFSVDGAESMRIDSAGNVGIGTTSPDYPLHIRTDAADARIKIEAAGSPTPTVLTEFHGSTGRLSYVGTVAGAMRVQTTATAIDFYPNNTLRMRMVTDGCLEVGLTTSTGAGTVNALNGFYENGVKLVPDSKWSNITGGIYNAGKVFIGTTNNALDVALMLNKTISIGSYPVDNGADLVGTIAGVIATPGSDIRLKKDIRPTSYGLADLNSIDIIDFTWDIPGACCDGTEDVSFNAQQLVQVFPKAVVHNKEEDRYGMRSLPLIALLVKSVQELTQRIEELENA